MYKKARLFEDDKSDNLAYIYANQHSRKAVGVQIYEYVSDGIKDSRQILSEWDLEQYANILIDDQGYEDIEDWKGIKLEYLINKINMKPGHAAKFMRKVGQL